MSNLLKNLAALMSKGMAGDLCAKCGLVHAFSVNDYDWKKQLCTCLCCREVEQRHLEACFGHLANKQGVVTEEAIDAEIHALLTELGMEDIDPNDPDALEAAIRDLYRDA